METTDRFRGVDISLLAERENLDVCAFQVGDHGMVLAGTRTSIENLLHVVEQHGDMLDILEEMVSEHACKADEGRLASCGVNSTTAALRMLAWAGRVIIESEDGDYILARPVSEQNSL